MSRREVAVAVAMVLMAAGAVAAPPDRIAELERKIEVAQAQIDVCRDSAAKFNEIGRDCDKEAKECLSAKPPRYTSAAGFQRQAREAYAEARKEDAQASKLRREIAQMRQEIARLRASKR